MGNQNHKTKKKLKSCYYVSKVPAIGKTHKDTKSFDDQKELENFADSLLECRIIKICLWYGRLMPTLVVNGIQLTYRNLDTWQEFETKPRFGDHQLLGYQNFTLSEDDLIVRAHIRTGEIVDQLSLFSKNGIHITQGGSTGRSGTFDIEQGTFIVGTHGGFGGHLHNIGFYVAPLKDIRYWRRRSYLLMRAWIEKKKSRKDVEKAIRMKIQSKNKSQWPETSFLLLVYHGNQVFAKVMSFI